MDGRSINRRRTASGVQIPLVPDVQPARAGRPGTKCDRAVHARRRHHRVPRIRPRPASHADAGQVLACRASRASNGTRSSFPASSWRTSLGGRPAHDCARRHRRAAAARVLRQDDRREEFVERSGTMRQLSSSFDMLVHSAYVPADAAAGSPAPQRCSTRRADVRVLPVAPCRPLHVRVRPHSRAATRCVPQLWAEVLSADATACSRARRCRPRRGTLPRGAREGRTGPRWTPSWRSGGNPTGRLLRHNGMTTSSAEEVVHGPSTRCSLRCRLHDGARVRPRYLRPAQTEPGFRYDAGRVVYTDKPPTDAKKQQAKRIGANYIETAPCRRDAGGRATSGHVTRPPAARSPGRRGPAQQARRAVHRGQRRGARERRALGADGRMTAPVLWSATSSSRRATTSRADRDADEAGYPKAPPPRRQVPGASARGASRRHAAPRCCQGRRASRAVAPTRCPRARSTRNRIILARREATSLRFPS